MFPPERAEKSYVVAVCLSGVFGVIGVHHFYTFGGLGFWQLIDVIVIACGSFTDSQGLPIKP